MHFCYVEADGGTPPRGSFRAVKRITCSRSVLSHAAFLSIATGLLALAACGHPHSETAPVTNTKSALVDESDHYVGAASLKPQQLALTFDDGPSAMTSEISTYLKSENVRATFFVNGARITTTQLPNPMNLQPVPNATAILQQLKDDGHLVANHTTTHRNLSELSNEERVAEIAETDALITLYGGTPYNRSLIRPPAGTWSPDVKAALQGSFGHYVGPIYSDIGLTRNRYPKGADDSACFTGALVKEDGNLIHSEKGDPLPDGFATSEECANAYLYEIAAVGQGIVLLREGFSWQEGQSSGNTIDLVKRLVPALKQSGFSFVRVDEIPVVAADLPQCAGGCSTCTGPNPDQCVGCPDGNVLLGTECQVCEVCAAGTYTTSACSATAQTVCTPCPEGTYSSAGAEACATCASCNDNDACTTDTCAPTGCTHTPIANCSAAPPPDTTPEATAAPSEDASGCSVGAPRAASSSAAMLVALGAVATAFAKRSRRRR